MRRFQSIGAFIPPAVVGSRARARLPVSDCILYYIILQSACSFAIQGAREALRSRARVSPYSRPARSPCFAPTQDRTQAPRASAQRKAALAVLDEKKIKKKTYP